MATIQKRHSVSVQDSSSMVRRKAAMAGVASAVFSGLAVANPSYGAYTLTNTITASTLSPYVTTDTTGQNVNYSNISLLTNISPSFPNGANNTALVGVIGGTFTTNGTVLTNGVTTSDKGMSAYSAYLYNSNGLQLVGLYTTTATGYYSQTNVRAVNSADQVLGGESRNSTTSSTTGGVLGAEVWLSSAITPTTSSSIYLGLFGPNNTYTKSYSDVNGFSTDTGTYSYQSGASLSQVTPASTTGYAVGTSFRYAGDNNAAIGSTISGSTLVANSTSLGQSSWIETSAGIPTEIGLTGAGNSYTFTASSNTVGNYYSNSVSGVNANGVAFGSSSAYTNAGATPSTGLGTDGFVYNATAATPNTPVGMYYSGQTLSVPNYGGGTPLSFNYYASPTTSVGTTPVTSQYRSTSLGRINATGTVVGTANYYPVGQTTTASRGTVAFSYDGTNYIQLGYTTNNFPTNAYPLPVGVTSFVNGGPSYVGQMASSVQAINNAGTIAGTSTTYVGQGTNAAGANNSYTDSGSAAWSSTPAGVLTQIGLYNQGPTQVVTQAAGTANAGYSATYNIHQNPSQYGPYSDTPSLMNSTGLIAGSAQRYSSTGASLGADAWVYDPNAGVTYPVDPTDENATGYVFENIAYLSDTGILVGEYKNTSSSANYSAFIWNDAAPTTSFTVLNGVNVSGLTTAGFQSLIEAYYADNSGSPIYVVGSTGAAASNTITGLGTVVPEPTTLSLLGIASLGLLGRRRKA